MDDDLIVAHGEVRQADALSASAGAVRLGPHAQGDEPQAHRRGAICGSSSGCARPGPTSCCRAISSSASRARPRPISRRRWIWCARSGYGQAYSFKYSPRPPRHPGGRRRRAAGVPGRWWPDDRLQRLQALLGAQQRAAFRRRWSAREVRVLFEKPGPREAGQMAGKSDNRTSPRRMRTLGDGRRLGRVHEQPPDPRRPARLPPQGNLRRGQHRSVLRDRQVGGQRIRGARGSRNSSARPRPTALS
jgi:hypothetical protein